MNKKQIEQLVLALTESTELRSIVRDKEIVLLSFTNRSGSNYIASRMRQARLISGGGEAFLEHVLSSSTPVSWWSNHIASPPKARWSNNRKPSVKVGWWHWEILEQTGFLNMFAQCRVVRIRRQDRLRQAISYSIALQTSQWTSNQTAKGVPEFRPDQIQHILHELEESDLKTEIFLSSHGYPVMNVVYEEFEKDEKKALREVAGFLDLNFTHMPRRASPMKVQRNSLNEEFRRRFLALKGDIAK